MIHVYDIQDRDNGSASFRLRGAGIEPYWICWFDGNDVVIPFPHRIELVPLSEEQKFDILQQVAAALGWQ